MKNILKSRLFMFLITALVFTGVGVLADNLLASEIEYGEGTVADAIDDLYGKAKPDYNGSVLVTPSNEEQVLSTNNTILNSDITVNPIPSTYKNLTTPTNAQASDIVSGKTAYDNLGNLITGTSPNNCVSGSFTCTACTTSTGQTISLPFRTNSFYVFSVSHGSAAYFYNKSIDASNFYDFRGTSASTVPLSSHISITDSSIIFHDWGASHSGHTFYYAFCN